MEFLKLMSESDVEHFILVVRFMIKTLIIMMITVFVVCMPLGDPKIECRDQEFSFEEDLSATDVACAVFELVKVIGHRSQIALENAVDIVVCVVTNVLYDTKIKFYYILEKVDRYDLCRTVCCPPDGKGDSVEICHKRNTGKCVKCRSKNR